MKTLLLIFALTVGVAAQAKVYVAPMDGDFDTFISAAMMEKNVPVVITTDENVADYIIVGTAKKGD